MTESVIKTDSCNSILHRRLYMNDMREDNRDMS